MCCLEMLHQGGERLLHFVSNPGCDLNAGLLPVACRVGIELIGWLPAEDEVSHAAVRLVGICLKVQAGLPQAGCGP